MVCFSSCVCTACVLHNDYYLLSNLHCILHNQPLKCIMFKTLEHEIKSGSGSHFHCKTHSHIEMSVEVGVTFTARPIPIPSIEMSVILIN